MTNAIGSAHCSIQYHDKYKIVKTKKHRVVELQQYTDYDFEPYLMRWFTVLGKEFFLVRSHDCKYGFEPYLVDYLMVLSNTVSEF